MARRGVSFGGEGASSSRKRGGDEADLDITPMIDVTFLLLIFFMVASTMQGTPDLDVPVARYGVGVETRGATIVTIKAPKAGTEEATIHMGDGAGPEGTLDDVRRFVEEGLQEDKTQVVIKAEREVPSGVVQEVAKVVTSVEGVQFYVGVQDDR